jgi:hypothetical protein
MAIATLAKLYNNPMVFTGVVKIRKCTAAKLMLLSETSEGVYESFYTHVSDILLRIPTSDLNAFKTRKICQEIIELTETKGKTSLLLKRDKSTFVVSSFSFGLSTYMLSKAGGVLSLYKTTVEIISKLVADSSVNDNSPSSTFKLTKLYSTTDIFTLCIGSIAVISFHLVIKSAYRLLKNRYYKISSIPGK